MNRKAIILIIFAIFQSFTTFAQNNWIWQNPLPQGNPLGTVQALGNDNFIAMGQAGTRIKTTDGGNSWDIKYFVNDITTAFQDFYFINNTIGYAVKGNIIYKTTDGGDSWADYPPNTFYSYEDIFF